MLWLNIVEGMRVWPCLYMRSWKSLCITWWRPPEDGPGYRTRHTRWWQSEMWQVAVCNVPAGTERREPSVWEPLLLLVIRPPWAVPQMWAYTLSYTRMQIKSNKYCLKSHIWTKALGPTCLADFFREICKLWTLLADSNYFISPWQLHVNNFSL